jgi:hypothetical protein
MAGLPSVKNLTILLNCKVGLLSRRFPVPFKLDDGTDYFEKVSSSCPS